MKVKGQIISWYYFENSVTSKGCQEPCPPSPKSFQSPWRTTALVKPPSRCNLISANIYSLICTSVSLSLGSLTTNNKCIDFPNLKNKIETKHNFLLMLSPPPRKSPNFLKKFSLLPLHYLFIILITKVHILIFKK